MNKPIIGIAGNERASATFEGNLITYTHTNFVNAIENAGGIPLIIPMILLRMRRHRLRYIVLTQKNAKNFSQSMR